MESCDYTVCKSSSAHSKSHLDLTVLEPCIKHIHNFPFSEYTSEASMLAEEANSTDIHCVSLRTIQPGDKRETELYNPYAWMPAAETRQICSQHLHSRLTCSDRKATKDNSGHQPALGEMSTAIKMPIKVEMHPPVCFLSRLRTFVERNHFAFRFPSTRTGKLLSWQMFLMDEVLLLWHISFSWWPNTHFCHTQQ